MSCFFELLFPPMSIRLPIVLGASGQTSLSNGQHQKVVLLNNAATTPPFASTIREVERFLKQYGAFHRGAGPYADETYGRVQSAISVIRRFIGANGDQSLLFTTNTSAAINLFVRLLKLQPRDIVLTTDIEHTSNNLPWRMQSNATIVTIKSHDDGSMDEQDLERLIKAHGSQIKLLAITGASNMTGYIPNLPRLAKLAHSIGAKLFVDAAQLAPHRPINMTIEGIDALAFSAHKIYAPFGLGVLALPKEMVDCLPVDPGGGSVDMVTTESVIWAPASVRHQTGTWNVTGIIALASSLQTILDTGWERIYEHERELLSLAVAKLRVIPGIKTYVPWDVYITQGRIGTITFNLPPHHHALLSAILANEYGIESRAGTICNHRLVRRWLKVTAAEQEAVERAIKGGNRLASYGIVRISLGLHNTTKDIERLVEALIKISQAGSGKSYRAIPEEEIYVPNN